MGAKRWLQSIAAVLGALALAPAASAAGGVPTHVPGVLVVGVHTPSARFEAGILRGGRVVAARGLEVDLARAIAHKLGLRRVEFRNVASDSGFTSPGSKPWDLALGRIKAEATGASSGIPYLDVPQGVLLRKALDKPARSEDDLRWLRLCARAGTTGADLVKQRLEPVVSPVFVPDDGTLLRALADGPCEAVVGDLPALAADRAAAPARYGRLAGRVHGPVTRYVIVLPESSPLRPFVEHAVQGLAANHAMRALSVRWLGVDLRTVPWIRPATGKRTVTLVGDSVAAAFGYSAPARELLGEGLDFRFEAVVCRRLVAPSCGHPPPPTALQSIESQGRALGQTVIMDIGYNDNASTYAEQLDQTMHALLAAGVRHVIWVTLRETTPGYRGINDVIRAATARWPELEVADWNGYSSGRPWFASERIHLNADGALGLARLLRSLVVPLTGVR
jgi:ABC-type amino acid transport substrate-binding protein